MLLQTITRLVQPISRLLLRTVSIQDPWQRYAHDVPLTRYGQGASRSFRWYFEGESIVPVTSIEDVLAWLLTCEYVGDLDLFNEADFWQHPRTFEHLQQGDCEDFSLWAWRKLVELGYDAEFVAGYCLSPQCEATGHTWVLVHDADGTYLLDPVVRDRCYMMQPLPDVRNGYLPEVSVDARLQRFVYAGYFIQLMTEETAPQAG